MFVYSVTQCMCRMIAFESLFLIGIITTEIVAKCQLIFKYSFTPKEIPQKPIRQTYSSLVNSTHLHQNANSIEYFI